ncbi:hypothetical protein [Actinoplanes sp. TFC3]|uniref:hypothetical protein n=1 Tax=Actinoplanes sp. TFC3 TaxID=1710355 RepID=UPI0008331CD0|nr:hypothetical protein [Actinoplanes sp. TFC3]
MERFAASSYLVGRRLGSHSCKMGRMAVIFELVVNFGSDVAAAEAAQHLVVAAPPLTVGHREIALHGPMINRVRDVDDTPLLLLSVLPVGVSWGFPGDSRYEPVRLSTAHLSALGHQLYELLKQFTKYRTAVVGWDPESFAGPAELRRDWSDELATGTLPGVVLAEDVLADVRGAAFVPFVPGFVWVPYAGEA